MSYESHHIMEHLPWARRFARSCASRLPNYLDHDDLQSAGVLGYLKAAERYDASKGASFRGFCAMRIRGAVLDELRRWDWAPRSVYETHRRITQVTLKLIEELGYEPNQNQIAEALGVSPEELGTLQQQAQVHQVVSLEDHTDNQGEEALPLSERIADPRALSPDQLMLKHEERQALLECLRELPKTQATVIVLHYLQNIPLWEVAEALQVTSSRVSQLHHQALDRLRRAWQREQRKE